MPCRVPVQGAARLDSLFSAAVKCLGTAAIGRLGPELDSERSAPSPRALRMDGEQYVDQH